MNKAAAILTTTLAMSVVSLETLADSPLSLGDPEAQSGELKLNGAIRTRFLSKNYQNSANEGSQNNDWRLADIRLVLSYENPNWIASMDGRCYQYDRLCDAVFLRTAWAGYKFNDQQKVTLGLQPIEFGFGTFWGSSYYETLMNTVGFEDISNLGLKYALQQDGYQALLGFYPTDGGNYKGTSRDSSRYSANFVKADDLTTGTHLDEKNMWIGRLSKSFDIEGFEDFSTELGGSFWYSELENKRTHRTGQRKTWNLFAQTDYNAWQWMTLYGQQRISNKDDLMADYSTLGAFDVPYQIANKGSYIVNEINYSFKDPYLFLENIKPYISHSRFFKDRSSDQDSDRLIAGVGFNHKAIGVQAEYIWSRNDPMTGGSVDGLAQGDRNGWDQMLYIALGYYF